MKKPEPYTLTSVMHSGKTVARTISSHKKLIDEVAREKSLRAFYREAFWVARNGKLQEVSYV